MAKSRDAFRTISEVSEILETPAHVLRFWESKFKQIKPVKRAGGRRYYRPDDLALLAAIKDLLHEKGHSIKDAQKLIRDTGVKQVVAQGHVLLGSDDDTETQMDLEMRSPAKPAPQPAVKQSDLFAGAETPAPVETTPENIFAHQEESSPAVTETTRAPEIKSAPIDLPSPPKSRDDVTARILASLVKADPAATRANAAQIAPLLSRLNALRDELRHPW